MRRTIYLVLTAVLFFSRRKHRLIWEKSTIFKEEILWTNFMR